jgi:hypothetical protein
MIPAARWASTASTQANPITQSSGVAPGPVRVKDPDSRLLIQLALVYNAAIEAASRRRGLIRQSRETSGQRR